MSFTDDFICWLVGFLSGIGVVLIILDNPIYFYFTYGALAVALLNLIRVRIL